MKYVIVNVGGLEVPRIFSELEGHSTQVKPGEKAISAGFCRFEATPEYAVGVKTFGYSTSLGLSPRPEDAAIIDHTLRVQLVCL